MSPPRPILKRSPRRHNNVVHFPSSPILTRIFPAHSPATYDRTPIVVEPNLCALPERGCPGRTYTLVDGECSMASADDGTPVASVSTGKHLHPRAVMSPPFNDRALDCEAELSCSSDETSLEPLRHNPATATHIPPPLIPDLSSSESEESDGFASPPVEHVYFPMPTAARSRTIRQASIPMVIPTKQDAPSASLAQFLPTSPNSTALSFLPHPPSPPEGSRPRRRRDKPRQPRDEEDDTVDEDGEFKHLDDTVALTACALDDGDEGCLAGF